MKKNNKAFAEKHAGEYFLYDNVKVRVVGYRVGRTQILVSVPEHIGTFGWENHLLEPVDIFTKSPSNGDKFWYAEINELK